RVAQRARVGLGWKVRGDLDVLEVEACRRQGRGNACHGSRVIDANDEHFKGRRSQGPHFHRCPLVARQPGQESHMADDVRCRIALEVRWRKAAKMRLHHTCVQIRALAADGKGKVDNGHPMSFFKVSRCRGMAVLGSSLASYSRAM